MKGNKPYTITLKSYEFDKIITKTYDTTSAILLGISTFINNHMELLKVNRNEKLSIPFQLLGMYISIPEIRCVWIGGLENNKQLNIEIYIKNTDREFIIQTSLLLAVIVFSQYNDYEQYMISFRNERLAPTWIRFKNIEVKNMFNSVVPFDKTIEQVIKRSDCLIWDASIEDIDLQEVKYFRFPNHSENNYKINNVADASNEDRKRLKAHLFIGDINNKDEILRIIKKSIEWLKCVKNPPSPTLLQKHGTMEADSLYINVYKNDGRGDKELFPQNDNFVCMVDYNIDGETTLEHGGIIQNIWNQLHHEKIDKIQIAWRESKYIIRKIKKIGANDLCPCGSGKKYKRCCRV